MPKKDGLHSYDNERDAWEKAMRERGHEPELAGYDGKLEIFAACCDIHHGPRCVRCGWTTCIHCNDEMIIPDCSK